MMELDQDYAELLPPSVPTTPLLLPMGAFVRPLSDSILTLCEKVKEVEQTLAGASGMSLMETGGGGLERIYLGTATPTSLLEDHRFGSFFNGIGSSTFRSLRVNHPDGGVINPRSDYDILEEFHSVHNGLQGDHSEKCSWISLTLKVEECVKELGSIQGRFITQEVIPYKREQQLAKNGLQRVTKSLEDLQGRATDLYDLHCVIKTQIQTLATLPTQLPNTQGRDVYKLSKLEDSLMSLFGQLISSTFLVQEEPPQVVKINTRFPKAVTVRLLLSPKYGKKLGGTPVQVRIEVLREVDARVGEARGHGHIGGRGPTVAGVISNPTTSLEFDEGSGKFTASFRNLQITKVDRKSRRGGGGGGANNNNGGGNNKQTITVTDEKFFLSFGASVRVGGEDFRVNTLSLPIVIITHGIQEAQAHATISWDNGFYNPYLHSVPKTVSWSEIAEMIRLKWMLSTGRGLDPLQLDLLKDKLVGNRPKPKIPGQGQTEGQVSFHELCRVPLDPGQFSLWDWIYSALKLVEKYSFEGWKNEGIHGFITRAAAESLLSGTPPGTFLLRFSDTILGGISVCYVSTHRKVYSLCPFTAKNLSFRSLRESVWDMDNLLRIYPNIPKGDRFPEIKSHQDVPGTLKPGGTSSKNDAELLDLKKWGGEGSMSIYIVCYPKLTVPDSFL